MASVTNEEIHWVISKIAAQMLTRMGDRERRDALKQTVRDWLPGADIDEFELRRCTEAVASGMYGMANLVDERRQRLEKQGRATPRGI